MTTYEVLCCYVSDKWYNYLNPLSNTFTYMPGNIERNLDTNAVDSYLGRAVAVAQLLNNSWCGVTAENLDAYIATLRLFNDTGIFWSRPWSAAVVAKVRKYLTYKLPAAFIEPMIDVFKLELWCSKDRNASLNDPKFLKLLQNLESCSFAPIRAWFSLHTEASSEITRYKEAT